MDVCARKLKTLLDSYSGLRVVVVGTTCTGKSTMLAHLPGAYDMDELVFPKLTAAERDYVCQKPWTPEIGRTMARLTKERVRVEPGHPVFGTVVLESDVVICLMISEALLRERTAKRGVSYDDARNMQSQIEEEVERSGIQSVDFIVG